MGRLSIFNHLVRGPLHFPAQTQLMDQFNQGVLSFQDLDAMFASHVISAGSKPMGEYRVILLGDSSIWGYALQSPDILSEQINKINLVTCGGKTVRAYDLAYPLPSFMRDLLILDQARQYEPDLVVWPVTLLTFLTNNSDRFFLSYQSDRVLQLVKTYHLRVPAASHLHSSGFWDQTIFLFNVRELKLYLLINFTACAGARLAWMPMFYPQCLFQMMYLQILYIMASILLLTLTVWFKAFNSLLWMPGKN